jgi:hypothetical protein
MEKLSINDLILLFGTPLNKFLSLLSTILKINVLNPFLKPLFITSSLLKFISYCSLILIFLTV